MLSTHYRSPRSPADRDLHILDLLARQAADWVERTQAAEELRQAKAAAEAANRAKDEFLANVSHEIRTPFGAILGMTDLVLETPLGDDQRQCLETVKSAAEGLLGLIDDLLDFAKIEAGKLELAPADFSLRGNDERHRADPGRTGRNEGAGTDLPAWDRTCPTPWWATRAGCGRCCSTWSATPSSSPDKAR